MSNPSQSIATRLQALEYMLAMELDRRFQALLGSVLCCSGGLAAFRRSVIIKSKGFCSAPRWVSEDLDMTMKSHRLGDVQMAHAAVGYTEVPSSFRALIRQRYRWAISGTVAFYLHRGGIARRSYWHDGRVGFFGLPILGAVRCRDTFAIVYPYLLVSLLLSGHGTWLFTVLGVRMILMALQLAILTPILHERQGSSFYWLIPLFVLVYGPMLLVARFAGAWTGIKDIQHLRAIEHRLEHEGLDPDGVLARGLEPTVAPQTA